MDRIDAMRAFVRTVDDGGLAAAARRLGRSPAAVTRAIAFLEEEIGTRLIRRTTRSSGPTEAGERFLDSCRRILADFDDATALAAGERSVPRGVLTVTGPLVFGRRHVRPVLDAFLDLHPTVQGRLMLLDRVVNLIDEGIDAAIRIGHLPDSSLIATRIGHIRRVVCASPAYLARNPPIRSPDDLASVRTIHFGQLHDAHGWRFDAPGGGSVTVPVRARLTVNSAEAAIESAIDGAGVTAVLSYQVADALRDGRLVLLLEGFEPPPLPVHLIYPEARLVAAKVRAFVDFAVPRLRALPDFA